MRDLGKLIVAKCTVKLAQSPINRPIWSHWLEVLCHSEIELPLPIRLINRTLTFFVRKGVIVRMTSSFICLVSAALLMQIFWIGQIQARISTVQWLFPLLSKLVFFGSSFQLKHFYGFFLYLELARISKSISKFYLCFLLNVNDHFKCIMIRLVTPWHKRPESMIRKLNHVHLEDYVHLHDGP